MKTLLGHYGMAQFSAANRTCQPLEERDLGETEGSVENSIHEIKRTKRCVDAPRNLGSQFFILAYCIW